MDNGEIGDERMTASRILVIENDVPTGVKISITLQEMGYKVPKIATSGEGALDIARDIKPDLVILGSVPPGKMTRVQVEKQIQKRFTLPVVNLVPQSDPLSHLRFTATRSYNSIMYPLDEENVRVTIASALSIHSLEMKIKKNEERYQQIVEHCRGLNFIVNQNCTLEYATRAVLRQFGVKPGASTGKPYLKVLSGEFIENLAIYIARVLSTGKKIHRQDEVMDSGGKKWYDTILTPLKDQNGSVSAVMVASRDITDQKRMEEEIRNEGIRQIEKQNEQLLILNDKIRNPLQVIKSLMELDEGPSRGKVLEQIALIDSIVSKLDQGWLESEMVRKFLIEHYHHGQMDYTSYKGVAFDQGA